MFKKPLKQLEGEEPQVVQAKDRKKLKQTLQKQFDEKSIDKLFEYCDEFRIVKLEKSKMVLYYSGKDPILVDASGKGDFLPSVYCLALFPQLIKATFDIDSLDAVVKQKLQVTHGQVKNGDQVADFKADDVMGLRTPEGKVVAVGALTVGKEEFDAVTDAAEPVAMALHYVGDNLFLFGSQTLLPKVWPVEEKPEPKKDNYTKAAKAGEDEDEEADDGKEALLAFYAQANKAKGQVGVPVIGTGAKRVGGPAKVKSGTGAAKKDKDDHDDDKKKGGKGGKEDKRKKDTDESEEDTKDAKKDKKKGKKEEEAPKKGGKADKKGGEKATGDAKPSKKDAKKAQESEEEEEDLTEDKHKGKGKAEGGKTKEAVAGRSKKEVDDLVLEAFLNATAVTVDDGELPLEIKAFWTKFVLPCKTCPEALDIRNSSYGSLKKFFGWLGNQKMIEFKEAGKKEKEDEVVAINRDHKKIDGYEPTVNKPAEDKEDDDDDANNQRVEVTKEVTNLYHLSPLLKPYFGKLVGTDYVARDDFEKQLKDWLKKENLLLKDRVQINKRLDDDFDFGEDAEFEAEEGGDQASPGHKGEEEGAKPEEEEEVHAKKTKKGGAKIIKLVHLIETLESKAKKVYRIKDVKAGTEVYRDGTFEGVGIYSEKAHGKTVTRINQLEVLGLDPKKLYPLLLKKFEATGEVHDAVVDKHKIKEITLNGAYADDLKDYVETELKVPEKWINFVNKLALKKGKIGPMNQA